jgi:ABC-type transport system substrate-binding protein
MFTLALVVGVTLFIMACGEAATAVPEPAATTAPAATAMPAATTAPAATAVPRATAAPTKAAPAPSGKKLKVQKLRFAMPSPTSESNRTWAGSWNYISQHDAWAETLLRVDPEISGKVDPLLAESWESSNGFKTWSFKLREGIPFQFGWGEVTAQDVVHTYDQLVREDSLATLKGPAWDLATPEIVDDYTIKFHFENPYLDGIRLFSRWAGDLIIVSKAQWDAEGLDAFDQIQTAGTGPYQNSARDLGASITFERVPEGHWKYDVDFEEFEFVWAPESLTRMAMILAEEAHVSQVERTLQPDAEARGMQVITSTQEAVQTYTGFGGLYFENTEKWPDHYTPGLPLENINIRKAMNLAVDRDAIKEEIYLGRATPNYRHVYHRNNEGWNPAWVDRWEAEYGYQPEEAMRLLAAEGYGPDNPLKLNFISTTIPGSPELHDVIEATQIMFADVGVEVTIEKLDFGQWLDRLYEHKMANAMRASRNLPIRTVQEGLRIFYTKYGTSWGFNHPVIVENYECLVRSADLAEREACARTAGDFLYDNYADIPMFHLNADVTVNPEYVESYVWPGLTSAGVSHFHNIRGVRD